MLREINTPQRRRDRNVRTCQIINVQRPVLLRIESDFTSHMEVEHLLQMTNDRRTNAHE